MRILSTIALCFAWVSLQAQWDPIYTQQELNDLGNAGYSWYYEGLTITTFPGQDSSTMITDLTPLSVFDSIAGDLIITDVLINSLDGLENLKHVGDVIISGNPLLEDASALNGELSLGELRISYNPNLMVLPDLSQTQKIQGISISENPKLEKVYFDLSKVSGNGFEFYVYNSVALDNIKLYSAIGIKSILLSGNDNLDSIHVSSPFTDDFSIRFTHNASLTTITGFQQLDAMPGILISYNTQLANLCFLQPFINDLTDDPYVLDRILTGNAPGANSKSEIFATDCSDFNTSISELGAGAVMLYPNPASQWVEVKGNTPKENITLYTVSGQLVKNIPLIQSRFNVSDLPKGMYLVKTANEVHKLLVE